MIYIGKRSSKKHPDIDTYFGSGVHLKRAIKKYGKENFLKEILYIVDSAEEAEALEEKIVDAEFIARKDTYNMIIGGQKGSRGMVHSEESKERMRGKTMSKAARVKISASQKGKVSPNKGKKLSEETRAKISAANKGLKRSDETRKKISAAVKGRHLTEEHKAKLSAAKLRRSRINND